MIDEGWPMDWSQLGRQDYLQGLKKIRNSKPASTPAKKTLSPSPLVTTESQHQAMALNALMQEVEQIGKSVAHLSHFHERRELLMEQLFPVFSLN